MTKINKISVSNYKGIDSLDFSPRDINIIVGPNNSGKSSLLSAIALGFHALNGFKVKKSKEFFSEKSLNPPDHQIYESNKNKAKISLNLVNTKRKGSHPIELIIAYGERIPPDEFNAYALNEFIDRHAEKQFNEEMENTAAYIPNDKDSKDYLAKKKAEIADAVYTEFFIGSSKTLFFKLKHQKNVLIESYLENLRTNTSYRKRRNLLKSPFRNYFKDSARLNYLKKLYDFEYIFLSHFKKFNIIQFFAKLSQSPNFYNVLDRLKEKLNYVYDIRESEGKIYIVTLGSDKSKIFIPFELMGDGFQSLLITTIIFEVISKGIVLLEEPENSLHPGYMHILVNTILKKSENRQFFLSTHSLDFIKILVESAEKTNQLDKILLLRLNRLDNKVNREILIERDIMEELKGIKVDLRGY